MSVTTWWKPPFFMRHGGAKVVHINFQSAAVDPVYFPQLEVVGDIANSIRQLKDRVTVQSQWDFDFFREVHAAYLTHRRELEDDDRFPILPERFVKDVRGALPRDGIVTLDNGVYKIWFARNYPAAFPISLLLDNGLDYGNPDFVAYAQAYGAKGWRVGATEELQPRIKACLAEPAVHLIDVPVDYSLNDQTLNVTIKERSKAI